MRWNEPQLHIVCETRLAAIVFLNKHIQKQNNDLLNPQILKFDEMILFIISMISKFQKKQEFTHFLSLPFIRKQQREQIDGVQRLISAHLEKVVPYQQQRKASNMLAHLTLSMLDLPSQELMSKAT